MPKLIVLTGLLKNQTFEFSGEVLFVSRSEDNDVQIKEKAISRKHLKLYTTGERAYIEDLNSKNGTLVNGKPIAPGKGCEVTEDDIIKIANTEIRVSGLVVKKAHPKEDSQKALAETGVQKTKKGFDKRQGSERKSLDLIWGVTELLRQSMDISEILEKVVSYILDSMPRIDTVVIALFDSGIGRIWETIGKSRRTQDKKTVQYSQSIVNRVISEGKSVRMSNLNFEPPEQVGDSITALKLQSILCVPLISNAKMLGAIYLDSQGAYGFRKDDQLLLNSLSGPVAVAVEKAILAAAIG